MQSTFSFDVFEEEEEEEEKKRRRIKLGQPSIKQRRNRKQKKTMVLRKYNDWTAE